MTILSLTLAFCVTVAMWMRDRMKLRRLEARLRCLNGLDVIVIRPVSDDGYAMELVRPNGN